MITYFLDNVYKTYPTIIDLIGELAIGYYTNYREHITTVNFANDDKYYQFTMRKNAILKSIDSLNKCWEVENYENN